MKRDIQREGGGKITAEKAQKNPDINKKNTGTDNMI